MISHRIKKDRRSERSRGPFVTRLSVGATSLSGTLALLSACGVVTWSDPAWAQAGGRAFGAGLPMVGALPSAAPSATPAAQPQQSRYTSAQTPVTRTALPMVGGLDLGSGAAPTNARSSSARSASSSSGRSASSARPDLPMVGALDLGSGGSVGVSANPPANERRRTASGSAVAPRHAGPGVLGGLDLGTSAGGGVPVAAPAATGPASSAAAPARRSAQPAPNRRPDLPMVGALDLGTSGTAATFAQPVNEPPVQRVVHTTSARSSGYAQPVAYTQSARPVSSYDGTSVLGALDPGTSAAPGVDGVYFDPYGPAVRRAVTQPANSMRPASGPPVRSPETGGLVLPAVLSPNPSSMGFGPQGPAEEKASEVLAPGEVFVTADEMVRDDELGVVTARGNVLVVTSDQALRADTVSFNTAQSLLSASGNVSLVSLDDPNGSAQFGEYLELTGDMKDGFVRNVAALTAEGGRLAGLYAEQDSKARRKEVVRGVYTLCKPCDNPNAEGRTRAPIWQIKAGRVIHDEEAREIIFRDAWLEVFGIPTIYTPYISQPDPTVYRKSGMLAPSVGSSSRLGAEVAVPYYVVMDDYGDATLIPRFTGKENFILDFETARNFEQGEFWMRGSVNPLDRHDKFQGYYESTGVFHFDPVWSARFESGLTRRAEYLRRISVSPTGLWDYLGNRLAIEGYGDRSRATIEGFYFQTVTEAIKQDNVPWIPLLADVSLVSDPLWNNSHIEASLNSMILRRTDGADSARLIGRVAYELPFYDGIGGAYNLSASMRGDVYHARDLELSDGREIDGTRGRAVPQAHLIWRHPFVRAGQSSTQTIEPKIGVFAALANNNPAQIPNEDSRFFALDMGNLFQPSRLSGFDRVEGGQWTSYALHYGYVGEGGGSLDVDVGQSYRLQKDRELFGPGSGLEDNFSDYLARVRYSPVPGLALQYDAQLSHDDLTARRHDLRVFGSYGPLSGSIGYLYAQEATTMAGETYEGLEEVSTDMVFRFHENWSLRGHYIYNISDAESVRLRFGLAYEDECLLIDSALKRDFTREYGIEGGTSFVVTLTLKTLGSYSFSPALGMD